MSKVNEPALKFTLYSQRAMAKKTLEMRQIDDLPIRRSNWARSMTINPRYHLCCVYLSFPARAQQY